MPDPSFPFLGVHFTRMIEGGVECGPNAVLAFAREGYRKTDINLGDLCETLAFRGFRKLAWKYWRIGAGEMWRSLEQGGVRAGPAAPDAGNPQRAPRARPAPACGRWPIAPDGAMVDDFVIQPDGPDRQRAQRPVAGRDLVAEHRQAGGGEAGGAAGLDRRAAAAAGRGSPTIIRFSPRASLVRLLPWLPLVPAAAHRPPARGGGRGERADGAVGPDGL